MIKYSNALQHVASAVSVKQTEGCRPEEMPTAAPLMSVEPISPSGLHKQRFTPQICDLYLFYYRDLVVRGLSADRQSKEKKKKTDVKLE